MERGEIRELPVVEIVVRDDLQLRAGGTDKGLVAEYAEAMQDGKVFLPITVFGEKGQYFLADGFKTLAATLKVGGATIGCCIRPGGHEDALEHALGANDTHGQRRTAADKHHVVTVALKNSKWGQWNNREIGRLCNVSDIFVAKVKKKLIAQGVILKRDKVKTRRHGKIVEQKAEQTRSNKRPRPPSAQEKQQVTKRKRGPKSQDDIDILDINRNLEELDPHPYSGKDFIEKHGAQILTDKAKRRLEWFAELYGAIANTTPFGIKLNDNKHYHVPLDYVEQLKKQFPKVDVVRALSDCATHHGMHPEGRKTHSGIKRHILFGVQDRAEGGHIWQ
ncbi:MAG: hypothetical protein IIB77_06925 [Proteobacteria bacterium]|nr:hypothetical protein [Pseudomonadota bacterium]